MLTQLLMSGPPEPLTLSLSKGELGERNSVLAGPWFDKLTMSGGRMVLVKLSVAKQ